MTSIAAHADIVTRAQPPVPGFISCLNGRSHCAEESIVPAHLFDGARVLYETISTLDTTLAATRR